MYEVNILLVYLIKQDYNYLVGEESSCLTEQQKFEFDIKIKENLTTKPLKARSVCLLKNFRQQIFS